MVESLFAEITYFSSLISPYNLTVPLVVENSCNKFIEAT
jgi:hypothetical protein